MRKVIHHHNQFVTTGMSYTHLEILITILNLDNNFLKDLNISVKVEIESMHCYHAILSAITVYTLRNSYKLHGGEKSYHFYVCVSDEKLHDQKFVKLVLEKMLESIVSLLQMC